MAGSYNHIVTDQGNLVSNERFVKVIENLGDAYETVEELYGMIWWLAHSHRNLDISPVEKVEHARQYYQDGLQLARETPDKGRYYDGG